jgi:hypothetical protein
LRARRVDVAMGAGAGATTTERLIRQT